MRKHHVTAKNPRFCWCSTDMQHNMHSHKKKMWQHQHDRHPEFVWWRYSEFSNYHPIIINRMSFALLLCLMCFHLYILYIILWERSNATKGIKFCKGRYTYWEQEGESFDEEWYDSDEDDDDDDVDEAAVGQSSSSNISRRPGASYAPNSSLLNQPLVEEQSIIPVTEYIADEDNVQVRSCMMMVMVQRASLPLELTVTRAESLPYLLKCPEPNIQAAAAEAVGSLAKQGISVHSVIIIQQMRTVHRNSFGWDVYQC